MVLQKKIQIGRNSSCWSIFRMDFLRQDKDTGKQAALQSIP